MTVTKEQIKQAKETLEQLEKEYDKQSSPFEYLKEVDGVLLINHITGTHEPLRKHVAPEFTKAIQTMIDLRLCEGVKAFACRQVNYYIYNSDAMDILEVEWKALCNNSASPYFETREHAQSAIETIGEERINHMFKTLSGME